MIYFFCYIAVFISIIVIIELVTPELRGTDKQVREDFEMLKSMFLHGNSKIKTSIILAILLYLCIIHVLTILVLSTIEWLAKIL